MTAKQIEIRAHLQALLKKFGAREIADQDVCVFLTLLVNMIWVRKFSYSALFAWLTSIVYL